MSGPSPHHPLTPSRPGHRLWRIGVWLAVAGALAATFCLYWWPDVAFDLATRIWSCI